MPKVKKAAKFCALMVLGYSPAEANKAVSAVYREDMDIETIIKNALKGLARP